MEVRREMEEVVTRILEDWALMLVEPEEGWEGLFQSDEELLVAALHFQGIVNGRYQVICQAGFAQALAGNLLGLDGEALREDMLDALKEMVNVLSGNLLTSSYGEDAPFALTAPEIHVASSDDLGKLLSKLTLCYRADDQPVLVNFVPEEIGHAD